MGDAPWWERLVTRLSWYWPPTRRDFRRVAVEFEVARAERTHVQMDLTMAEYGAQVFKELWSQVDVEDGGTE